MFTNETESNIRNRMLNRIPNELSKIEGTISYDILSSTAIELALSYINLSNFIKLGFIETTSGQYLDLKAEERGITRKPPTKATGIVEVGGKEGTTIPKGCVFSNGEVDYISIKESIIDLDKVGIVEVEATVDGSKGNTLSNTINKINGVLLGVSSVNNPKPLENGYDAEDDESLRQRLLDSIRHPITSGNIHEYKAWAKEVAGVGDAKVFPTWDGPGTVKVVIIDKNGLPADETLIEKVFYNIENKRPIGASLTVSPAIALDIDLQFSITIKSGYALEEVKENIEKSIRQYFKSVAFKDNEYVSYGKIGSLILDTEGVIDYKDLRVNLETNNLYPKEDEIPVLSNVAITY